MFLIKHAEWNVRRQINAILSLCWRFLENVHGHHERSANCGKIAIVTDRGNSIEVLSEMDKRLSKAEIKAKCLCI